MRCRECNIDLSENYKKCPLCGEKAFDDEAKIKDIKEASYPENVMGLPLQKTKKPRIPFTFEKVKAYFNL